MAEKGNGREVLRELAEALTKVSDIARDHYNISDETLEKAVNEIDEAVSLVGERHGTEIMFAALVITTISAIEGCLEDPPSSEPPS